MNNLLIYLSILFVFLYLWDKGLYHLPVIYDILIFLLSLFLLLIGHFIYVYLWHSMLRKEYQLDSQIVFESESITIFNKYIPGKIWVVVGPVSYLKKFYNISTKTITHYSLYMQIIIIWSGLFIGLFFLKLLSSELQIIYFCFFAIFTILIFTNWLHLFTEKMIYFVSKKNINIPTIQIKKNIKILFFSILLWLIWSLAFYYLIISTTLHVNIPFSSAFVFPIASVIGIVALLSPGGLGIREGIMMFLLISIGVPSEISTQISIDARVWFLTFEVLTFITAFISIFFRKYFKEKVC